MCLYYIQVCCGNAPMVTKQIQSMILMSPMFCSQDLRTLVKTNVPFRPGVQSLVTINFELNTTYVLSRVTGHIEQCTKEIAKIYQKYLLQ